MVFLSYPDPCPVLQILPPTVSSPLLHPHTATPRVLTLDSLACMAAGPLLTSLPQSTLPFSPCFLLSHRSLSVHTATSGKGCAQLSCALGPLAETSFLLTPCSGHTHRVGHLPLPSIQHAPPFPSPPFYMSAWEICQILTVPDLWKHVSLGNH